MLHCKLLWPRSDILLARLQGIDRRERLRRLALETIDLAKDPYFMRNHLGQYECRLCLTLHTNEGNYLAHTQVPLALCSHRSLYYLHPQNRAQVASQRSTLMRLACAC